MTSQKRMQKIAFIEKILRVEFEGSYNREDEVRDFINEYWDEANEVFNEYKETRYD